MPFGITEVLSSIISALPPTTVKIMLAVLLGLFVGLEREWSNKPAGVRTFALTAILGVVFSILDLIWLIGGGVLFIITLAILLGYSGVHGVKTDEGVDSLQDESYGLALTTSVSLLVTYSIGILIGYGYFSEAIMIAVISSALLALKKELHSFAWDLTKDELQSAIEFSIIAFVIYPLLPTEPIDPWGVVDLQLVWLLVIAVSTIGFINYILARKYQGQSFLLTGFLGGLVNSTAVIISVSQRVKDQPQLQPLIIGSILLANSAMALRNAVIVLLFHPTALKSVLPLFAITLVGVGFTYRVATRENEPLESDLSSPFSAKNALTFGGLFLIVLIVSGIAEQVFGNVGFLVTAFLSGFVSSGTTTTTAITLFSTESIPFSTLTYGVLVGTIASILVKVVFAAQVNRSLIRPVLFYNGLLVIVGLVTAGLVTLV